jgi:hypothetical protein
VFKFKEDVLREDQVMGSYDNTYNIQRLAVARLLRGRVDMLETHSQWVVRYCYKGGFSRGGSSGEE